MQCCQIFNFWSETIPKGCSVCHFLTKSNNFTEMLITNSRVARTSISIAQIQTFHDSQHTSILRCFCLHSITITLIGSSSSFLCKIRCRNVSGFENLCRRERTASEWKINDLRMKTTEKTTKTKPLSHSQSKTDVRRRAQNQLSFILYCAWPRSMGVRGLCWVPGKKWHLFSIIMAIEKKKEKKNACVLFTPDY